TANSRKGETTIVPSGFVLFVPGEKRLYDGFGFAHQTTTDKGEAIASQEAYFKRLGLDPASALKAAKEETSYSRRSDNESGVFAVRRDFWGEVSGPWYVNTSYRPGNRNDDVGAVLPRRVRAEATEEYTNLVKAANDAYEIFEQGMSDE
ncbi:MAG: hypothetical protein KKA90_04585, partial [Nanoarchaeota archaeon]|nr:hypothetical protein [Nanoarchaeota archaeon]